SRFTPSEMQQSTLTCGLRTVLAEPAAQRHVLVGGREAAVRVDAAAEYLLSDGIRAFHQFGRNGHVVFGAQPAIAIAVEEDFARPVRTVGTGGVPQAPVEEDRR